MASTSVVTVLHQSRVAPPPGTAADMSLPLTFYDTFYWNFLPMQDLLFYKFPHSKTHFVETIIPKLKESLSLALKHFAPVAGNLLYPSASSGKLEIQYVQGDSIPLNFAESDDDFNYLVGNHAKNADRFYHLFPNLPPAISNECNHTTRTPLFAVQVTIFPNAGMCIAWANRHVIGDAKAVISFIRTWALINKFGGGCTVSANDSLRPFYDRAVIEDPFDLDTQAFNFMKMYDSKESPPATMLATSKVRATYEMSPDEIQKLKNFVLGKRPNVVRVSSFSVTCAFIWTCWLKSLDATGEEVDDINNKPECFHFLVDCRARWDPPIPPTYFGNCVVGCVARSTHGELIGSEGLLIAASLIGEAIQKAIHNKERILSGSLQYEAQCSLSGQQTLGVAGSPKFNVYGIDFGWGVPEKYESIAIDVTEAISLNKSRKFEGGLEVGLSLPKNRMDAFSTIFNNALRVL